MKEIHGSDYIQKRREVSQIVAVIGGQAIRLTRATNYICGSCGYSEVGTYVKHFSMYFRRCLNKDLPDSNYST